jgi:nitroreductase
MTVREAILARKSIRVYKDKDTAISAEHIELLLEAAMKAPSANNTRPWKLIVVRSRVILDSLAEIQPPYAKMLKDCPLAIIVCALPETQTGTLEGFYPQDCGAVTENILLQATELGLGTCWCGVYPKEPGIKRVREVLGAAIPVNAVPFNIIAVGYPAEDFGSRGTYEKDKVKFV